MDGGTTCPMTSLHAGPNRADKSSLRGILNDTFKVVIDPNCLARTVNPDQPRMADYNAGHRFESPDIRDWLTRRLSTTRAALASA
jgi:predicted ABC-type ATPase